MVKTLHLSIIVLLTVFLFGTNLPAWASTDLNVYLPVSGNPVTPHFKFEKHFIIKYPNGSKLGSLFEGKNITVSFIANSDNDTSVKQLMQQLNNYLSMNNSSTATFTHLTLIYQATIRQPSYADIDITITLIPTLENYILNKTDGNATLDMSWVSPIISHPVEINTPQYGNLEINYPVDLIQNQLPDVYNILRGTTAEAVLEQNLINATLLVNEGINSWASLFSPNFLLSGYWDQYCNCSQAGQTVPLTTFSIGGTTPSGGWPEIDQEFTADTVYDIGTFHEVNGLDINVEGLANVHSYGGKWLISTTKAVEADWISVTPEFPFAEIVLVFSIASLVLFYGIRRNQNLTFS